MAPTDSVQPKQGQHRGKERMHEMGQKVKRAGNIFYRFIKNFDSYDTTYISPNYYNFTAMAQNTNFFQSYKIQGSDKETGKSQSISTRPIPSVKVGPYFGWRWIFLGYTFDVSHPESLGKSTEFDFSLYSSMLGCDFVYIRNKGNFRLNKTYGFDDVKLRDFKDTHFSGLDAYTLSFSAYYVFNYKHFSYPAAYNQSTVQRKSCGSFITGCGYSKQHINFDYTQLPTALTGTEGNEKIIEGLKFSNINYDYYYINAGYAYNWVFARNFLLGISCTPSIGIRKAKGEKLKGNEILVDLKNFSCDCVSRLGLVWNNTHWFAGASFVSHLYLYRNSSIALTNSVNFANIYAGFFFNRRKHM